MKKRLIIFMSLMLTMIMATSVVFAKNVYEEKIVNDGYWAEIYEGDKSRCGMASTPSEMYIHLNGDSTLVTQLYSQIREYKYNSGWTSNKIALQKDIKAGGNSDLRLSKNKEMKGYYYTIGQCKNKNTQIIYDSYIFKSYQIN